MGFSFFKILGILNVVLFFLILLFVKKIDRNKFYLKYIILTLPLLIFSVIPEINSFIFISTLFFLFFYERNDYYIFGLRKYLVLVVLLMLSILIGFFVIEIRPTFSTFLHFLKLIPTFLFTSLLIKETSNDIDFFYKLIHCFRVLLITSFVFLLLQMLVGPNLVLTGVVRPNVLLSNGVRYPSVLADPQHYSQFVSVLCFISFIKPNEKKIGLRDLLMVIFCLIAIMSSGGRVGLMGLILGFSLIVFFSKGSYKILFLIAGFVIYMTALQFQDKFAIFKRGTDLDDAYEFRHAIWMEAIEIFKKFPFFGIGLDNYANYVFLHNPNQFWMENNELLPYDVPENGNLKILTELGAIGFLIIYTLILYPMTSAFNLFLRKKDFNLLFLFCSILSFTLSFNGTYTLMDQRVLVLILAVISCAISYLQIINIEDDVLILTEKQN